MKIILVNDKFPPAISGIGEYTASFVKVLKKKEHEVIVITSVQENKLEGRYTYQGIEVEHLFTNFPQRNMLRTYITSLYNPQITGKFKEILARERPDVVQFMNLHQFLSYHCLKIARKYSKTVFWYARDVMSFSYTKLTSFIDPKNLEIPKKFDYHLTFFDLIRQARKSYNPLRNKIIRYYLKNTDKLFCVSNALKKALETNGIKGGITIHSGINVEDFQCSESEIVDIKGKYNLYNKKIIFTGGRLSNAKGDKQILKALKIILKKAPETVLLVAGKEEGYGQKMKTFAKELGISDKVIFTGWLKKEEMRAVFNSIDVCVVPSICLDAFPKVNLEAMAAKKPVIGTCFGGTPEIVEDGITGYIINPLNLEMMAEKIIDLLKNPQKVKQFGEAGYKKVKKYFNLDSQVDKIIFWYQKMLDNKEKHSRN